MKKINFCVLFLTFFLLSNSYAQEVDSVTIKSIFDEALKNYTAYNDLRYLCKNIGGRICGSPQSEIAIEWGKKVMNDLGFDKVYLQETKVRHWIRGDKEIAKVNSKLIGNHILSISALGTSVGTEKNGIRGNIIEVKQLEDVEKLGEENVKGKIIFYNRAADQTLFNTFEAYGGVADQRVYGAIQAAKFGAIGIIIRSLTVANDDFPHTGIMRYVDSVKKIPACAVSTMGADSLSEWLKSDPQLELYIKMNCKEEPEVKSYNVIGELTGTEFPDEIILVGGHIDSWDTGEGAHDDGTGVVQSIETLRLMKSLGIKPKHTIRCVLFMDEEIGQRGARTYAEYVKSKNEKHIIAIESDEGGFSPYGFNFSGNEEQIKLFKNWQKKYLLPYGIYDVEQGFGGVDVSFLRNLDFPLAGLMTSFQRYMDYHHSPNDIFEHVNRRELQLGAASMATLVYLIDRHGWKE